jgi:hypothetical protein
VSFLGGLWICEALMLFPCWVFLCTTRELRPHVFSPPRTRRTKTEREKLRCFLAGVRDGRDRAIEKKKKSERRGRNRRKRPERRRSWVKLRPSDSWSLRPAASCLDLIYPVSSFLHSSSQPVCENADREYSCLSDDFAECAE